MDALQALEQLEGQEKAKRYNDSRKKGGKGGKAKGGKVSSSYVSAGAIGRATSVSRPGRGRSLPPPQIRSSNLEVPTPTTSLPDRPASRDSRRISFGTTPVPRFTFVIPTKTEKLSSGFVYDPRLNRRYNVSEKQWKNFNREVIEAAELRGENSWKKITFMFNKQALVKQVKKDLVYESELKSVLKNWNRTFKMKHGFSISLSLPGEEVFHDMTTGNTWGDKQHATEELKKFRLVVNNNMERAGSAYSRSSSMTRSISGEGRAVLKAAKNFEKEDEDDESKG